MTDNVLTVDTKEDLIINGTVRCGAKLRKKNRRCKKYRVPGRKRCRLHGGLTPTGVSAGSFKHGRYSKVMPERLRERFEDSLRDEDMLMLDREIAFVRALTEERMETLYDGETGELWLKLRHLWFDLKVTLKKKDKEKQAKLLMEIGSTIERGSEDYLARKEAVQLIERSAKLVESERKRIVEARKTIQVEQAMVVLNTMFTEIVDSVRRYADEETARKIIVSASSGYRKAIGS